MRYLLRIACISLLMSFPLWAQIQPSTVAEIEESIELRQQHYEQSVLKNYPVRNVGPVVMSGRVSDIAVHPVNPRVFYTAFGSGGIFKTTNSGNTMFPVFDHAGGALGIGDIAISGANPEVIWAGTGENNSSRSTYAGTGVYKSMDGGENWTYTGLRNTQHIGRIITHPTDVNTAWVGSMGALYSNNSERGVYKTTDGGETWTKSLFLNDSTGVIDLIMHPENPDELWAATWERDRKAWNFKEGGESSGLYRSTDGGENWTKVTNGLPDGAHVGRIGIDISKSNPDIMYVLIDNQEETKTERETNPDIYSQSTFLEISVRDFMQLDNQKLNQYLRRSGFPSEYDAAKVKADVEAGEYEPKALAEYLGDANSALFDTEIKGAEVYRSNDGGNSWNKVNSYPLDGIYFTYGYYFGEVRVDPNDPETIYVLGVRLIKSTDGGKTYTLIANNQNVHADHQAFWINPNDSQHLLNGNDGGLYESHDGGENFIHHNTAAVGQFYTVNVDMEEPYNIYGGLQDNGTFKGPSTSTGNREQPWTRLFGGDGMHVAAKPGNADIVYVGFQYGNYFRSNLEEGSFNRITPRHDVGEPRYRYNWNTPVTISHHNPDIIYFGSQRLNRSMDEGKTWTPISPDLTNDLPNGDVPYSTLTSIAESPLNFSVIWIGTDDGNIQLTRDGGASWTKVSDFLPQGRWISEVHASKFDEATAYVSMNGYRNDEFKTYIYKTEDYGQTWSSLKGDLPEDVVNIIVQDPVNPSILYAGLDHGSYVSLNDGENWHYLSSIPNVASYDMVVHPRDLDLVIATHGRSIYVMDIEPLHQIADRQNERITGIKPEDIRHSNRWGSQSAAYRDPFLPKQSLIYFLGDDADNQSVAIEIKDSDGDVVVELNTEGDHGINVYDWNLIISENDGDYEFLDKGTYTVNFKTRRSNHEVSFEIK
jgi:photosystem II stability/assembly factor-like uncharacterized protein